jgi:hypothetical protein
VRTKAAEEKTCSGVTSGTSCQTRLLLTFPEADRVTALSRTYATTISVVAFILAVFFLVYGYFLLRILGRVRSVNVRTCSLVNQVATTNIGQIIRFSLTAIVCAIALILQCAVLLFGTFFTTSDLTDIENRHLE